MVGAGISASLTNFGIIAYQWIIFKKLIKTSVKELLVTREDIKMLISGIKDMVVSR